MLYERIRSKRECLGLSQEELAKKLGYTSRSTIAKIESGKNDIPQSKVMAFAKALLTTPAYLMGWEDENGHVTIPGAVPAPSKKRVPILGRISAGEPSWADQNIEYYDYVDDEHKDFGRIVKGDSMIGARIFEDDVVYVAKDSDVNNGDIVIALINEDDATIKRYYRYNGEVILKPENPTLTEKRYKPEEVDILGTVKEVKFKAK